MTAPGAGVFEAKGALESPASASSAVPATPFDPAAVAALNASFVPRVEALWLSGVAAPDRAATD